MNSPKTPNLELVNTRCCDAPVKKYVRIPLIKCGKKNQNCRRKLDFNDGRFAYDLIYHLNKLKVKIEKEKEKAEKEEFDLVHLIEKMKIDSKKKKKRQNSVNHGTPRYRIKLPDKRPRPAPLKMMERD
jgi:hypothetical protein